MDTRGKVPHFTLRPHPVVSMVFILVLIVGLLGAMSFFSKEEGTGEFSRKGLITLMITGVLCICLAIVATAKMWFRHLWKKNSTHARHKNHSQYHPAMRDKEYRNRR